VTFVARYRRQLPPAARKPHEPTQHVLARTSFHYSRLTMASSTGFCTTKVWMVRVAPVTAPAPNLPTEGDRTQFEQHRTPPRPHLRSLPRKLTVWDGVLLGGTRMAAVTSESAEDSDSNYPLRTTSFRPRRLLESGCAPGVTDNY
jgi:hypothetical protein